MVAIGLIAAEPAQQFAAALPVTPILATMLRKLCACFGNT
jgi:uncharacterized protein (DUF697 family)